jgi:hypothetical protein
VGRIDAERHADPNADQNAERREFERRGKTRRDVLRHRAPLTLDCAEIALAMPPT